MQMKLKIHGFDYPPNRDFLPMLQSVFDGEYDVPYHMKSPRILDVGANIGAFSIWASHRWSGSTIYAYEPNPEIYKYLELNIDHTNSFGIIANDFGVGKEGKRTYRRGPHNIGEGGFYTENPTDTGIELYIRNPLLLPSANIIKIDTEGCELEILIPLIQDKRTFDVILLEYHRPDDRLMIDKLLAKDYVLMGAQIFNAHRGVIKYMNRECFPLKHIEGRQI